MNYGLFSTKKIILASRSPRRRSLLQQLGLVFDIRENNVQEVIDPHKSPEENVISLSRQKALDAAQHVSEAIVVGFDTIVVVERKVLEKPRDAHEAREMLNMLSGREHEVYTGFTIVEQPGGRIVSDFEKTVVKFRNLEEEEIERYIDSGSPFDKAGAYGIQDDMGALFVEHINGCFYNVVGLPLTKFYVALKTFFHNSHG